MKKKIIIDIDNTTFQSTKAICSAYNMLYKNHEDFTFSYYTKLNRYDMADICPLEADIVSLFETKLFFELLEPFENAVEVIDKLNKDYDVTFCSVGTPENIKLKIDLIHKYFGNSIKFVPIVSYDRNCSMDKSIISSTDAICIDDNITCLNSFTENSKLIHSDISNCYNIIFGKEYHWNTGSDYHRCLNWNEVYNHIIEISS